MPRLSHSEAVLSEAGRELKRKWEVTAPLWRDRARADFEKAYLEQLLPAVKSAVGAIQQVNRLLERAIRECS